MTYVYSQKKRWGIYVQDTYPTWSNCSISSTGMHNICTWKHKIFHDCLYMHNILGVLFLLLHIPCALPVPSTDSWHVLLFSWFMSIRVASRRYIEKGHAVDRESRDNSKDCRQENLMSYIATVFQYKVMNAWIPTETFKHPKCKQCECFHGM
jgi:hypothetical protein